MLLRAGLFVLLLLAADLLQAAPDAVVEGIQLPAWVTRDGKRQPLAIGTELKRNDEVSTGGSSRLLLRLGDGSMVKLGENGKLLLSELMQKRKEGFIAATLKVLEGAFRFTTEAAVRNRGTRDITVQFPTITAGIRGTDIWGKNLGEKEVVVLIEGKITVTRPGDQPVQMKDALTYLQAPKTGAATVEAVPTDLLKAWAAETEIAESVFRCTIAGQRRFTRKRFPHPANHVAQAPHYCRYRFIGRRDYGCAQDLRNHVRSRAH